MSKTKIIFAAVLLVIAAGIYFLFYGGGLAPSDKIPIGMEFLDTELHETKDGKAVWSIKVGRAELDADRNTARFTDVDGYFKDENIELHITAKNGMAKRNEKFLRLEGDVEGKTTDGAVLHAKNLCYDGVKGILSTDEFFTVEKDGKMLSADSFTADRVLKEIVAKGHAKLETKEETK